MITPVALGMGVKMTTRDDDLSLVDCGNHPEIYADAIGDMWIKNGLVNFIFFRWRKMDGVFRRVIVAEIHRPLASLGYVREHEIRLRLESGVLN